MLVLGLVIFMVADANKSPDFNPIGVALILTSLVVDAAISNLQEYIFTTYNTDEEELVFTSYAGGSLVLFLLCMATGDMTDGLNYLHHHEGYSLFSSTSVIVVFAACGFGLCRRRLRSLSQTLAFFFAGACVPCRRRPTRSGSPPQGSTAGPAAVSRPGPLPLSLPFLRQRRPRKP